MKRLILFACGHKGCKAGSVDVDAAGVLWKRFRGWHPGSERWDNDPTPLRLNEPNARPFIPSCPQCRQALRLERRMVIDGLTEAEATGKVAYRVIPPDPTMLYR
jgi:hypothetical protein